MPTIEIIDGIKINIYANDHLPPHFHAIYAEYEALIRIEDMEVLKGELPTAQYKKIRQWLVGKEKALMNVYYDLNPQQR